MKSLYYSIISALLLVGLVSCQSDSSDAESAVNVTQSFNVVEDHWTYVSVENGSIVGTSPFGDESADAQWKTRKDWDIAFCGDKVRTNGGTSGDGEGALQLSDEPYDQVMEAPAAGYVADSIVEVW